MPFYEDYGSDLDYFYSTIPFPGGLPAMHLHPHWEVLLITDPVPGTTFVNSASYDLDGPFMVLYCPFCLHKIEFPIHAPMTRIVFYYGKNMEKEHASALECVSQFQQDSCTLIPLSRQLAQELVPLINHFLSKPKGSIEQKLIFLLILNTVFHSVPESDIICTNGSSYYISDVIRYMSEHCHESISVEDIANAFFISRSKLNSDFKVYTGKPIHQLLTEIRISKAIYLFHSKSCETVQEVAEQVGMGNGFHFYSVFKKMVGVTPLQYAKRYQKKK